MRRKIRWLLLGLIIATLVRPMGALAQKPGPDAEVASLLAELPWPVVSVERDEGILSVCLEVPQEVLLRQDGMGVERVEDEVAHALTPAAWQTLHVLAPDEEGVCRPLSDRLGEGKPAPVVQMASVEKIAPLRSQNVGARSLAGKVIFVSAGHGWEWNGYSWKTQRPPYQQIIEDHNNAEAVDQYLIPYLERAGATVIPVRERDWNAVRVIVDDAAGGFSAPGWTESANVGYGTHYHFAPVSTGEATMTAVWTLQVPTDGRYALYAWVPAGSNRAPDAHYRIHHAGGVETVTLDQRIQPTTWRYLGTFPFRAGTAVIELSNLSAYAGTYVVADAVRLGGGLFDDLSGIATTASAPPRRPWWESCTFYYSQWMGLNPAEWAAQNWNDFNDVVARPMYARWRYRGIDAEAVYISWHTNGWNGTVRGTESYIHDGSTYPRTPGSAELQAAVHAELVHDIRVGWDPSWVDRGRRSRNLGELRLLWDADPANRLPGVLVEIAYHDNPDDAAALKEPRFNQLAARAIYQGIVHYFEQRDGVDLVELPEPPTHLYAQNLGGGAVRIAWDPSPTDGVGLVGEPATAYRLYLSEDGFGWGPPITVQGTSITMSGLPQGAVRYFYVTAINDGGESFPTEVLGFRVGEEPILVVNGFDKLNRYALIGEEDPVEGFNLRMWVDRINRRDYVIAHGEGIPSEVAWDSASNEAIRDGRLHLTDYRIVDWLLGEESTQDDGALDAGERAALRAYLDDGGALLLSGSEWAWWLEGVDPDFLRQTLHVRYVADDAGTYTAAGEAEFGDLGSIAFDAADGYDVDAPDLIAPADGAGHAVMHYTGGQGGTAAVAYDDGGRCLLLYGFPLETVRPEWRASLIDRSLRHLLPCVEEATLSITSPDDGMAYRTPPAFQGVGGGRMERVEVQIARLDDGTYWNGGQWQSDAVWLTANGTAVWSYPLPALTDGHYRLAARAVRADQPSGDVQAVALWIDTLSPTTPALLAPEDGFRCVAVAPLLRWTSVADGGSPIHYRLLIDDRVYDVETNEAAIPLTEGTHRWQVQAVDAAGNAGAWSESRTMTLIQYHAYLPLTLKGMERVPAPSPSPMPTPTPTPDPCTTWLDSDFEDDGDGWYFGNAVERSTAQVHEGRYAVIAGLLPGVSGGGTTLYSSIYRSLTLPRGGTIRLELWLYPIAEESGGDLQYIILKDANGLSHTLFSGLGNAQQWEAMSFDLSTYGGQSVMLYIGVKNDGDNATSAIYIDDITVSQCP